jgi:hypothetical protein
MRVTARPRLLPATRVALLAWCCASGANAQVRMDALVTTVGERVVMLSDVRLARDLGRVPPGLDDDAARETLVDRALMVAEVERFQQPDPPSSRIDALVGELRATLGPGGWSSALHRAGVDEDHVRALIADDLRLDAYLRQRFDALAEPGDDDVRQELERRVGAPGASQAEHDTNLEDRIRADLRRSRYDRLVADWVAELRGRAGR